MLHPVFSLESHRVTGEVGCWGNFPSGRVVVGLGLFVVWQLDLLACRAAWAYHQIPKI